MNQLRDRALAPAAALSCGESFVGEPLSPDAETFSASLMASGAPGLPGAFLWNRQRHGVAEVLEQWKETGNCRHGSGERYVRKHWFRIRTDTGLVMRVYFERTPRSSGGCRWRLFSLQRPGPTP